MISHYQDDLFFFFFPNVIVLLVHHNPNNTNTYSSNKLHAYVLFIFWNRKKRVLLEKVAMLSR